MNNIKFWIVLSLLISAIATIFLLPENIKYEGSNVIKQMELPSIVTDWAGKDISVQLNAARYDDISDAVAYQYAKENGESLIFIVLDVANFHFPNACLIRVGYNIRDLNKTELNAAGRKIEAYTIYSEKEKEGKKEEFLVLYWIVIDKKLTSNWVEQKVKQLFFSLSSGERVALMVRMDIPIIEGNIAEGLERAKQFTNDISQKFSLEHSDYIFGKITS